LKTTNEDGRISLMNHVFISHSVKDKDQAAADIIYDYLQNNGIKCFMDKRDLIPGIPYPRQLTAAVKESSTVLLVFSLNADSSEAVQAEIGLAKGSGKSIIPVRIEDAVPSDLAIFLTITQWLDAFPPPLEKYLPRILKVVKPDGLSPPPPPPPPPPSPSPVAPPWPCFVRDHKWHPIKYEHLIDWVKKSRNINTGKTLPGTNFDYRRNKYTGGYEIKLKEKHDIYEYNPDFGKQKRHPR
jgi:TIR domain